MNSKLIDAEKKLLKKNKKEEVVQSVINRKRLFRADAEKLVDDYLRDLERGIEKEIEDKPAPKKKVAAKKKGKKK